MPGNGSELIAVAPPPGTYERGHPQHPHGPHARRGDARRAGDANRQHGRGEDGAVEPASAVAEGAHEDRATHGMAEREDRRRTIGQHHLLHEGFKVGGVFGKVLHVTLARVGQRAIGQPLPAPVQRRHRKAAGIQIAHDLEVFLDEFGAPLEQADRALAPRRRRKPRKSKPAAVGRLDGPRDRPRRAPDWRGWKRGSWKDFGRAAGPNA